MRDRREGLATRVALSIVALGATALGLWLGRTHGSAGIRLAARLLGLDAPGPGATN
jgi:hypothetical protein